MINFEKTIISQFANSPTIVGMVEGMNEAIDPRADLQSFYDFVWNIDTAKGFGLDIWGKIVGIGRDVTIADAVPYFGFSEMGADASPWGQGQFYSDEALTTTYTLSDTAYRRFIMAKAMANITRCTVPAINRLLTNLFAGRGACYVVDLGGMAMRYVFEFPLFPYEESMIETMDLFPRPAGVMRNQSSIVISSHFGFSEMGGDHTEPFDSAPFNI